MFQIKNISRQRICVLILTKSFINIEIEKEKREIERERELRLLGFIEPAGTYRVQCLQTHQIRRNTTWPGMEEDAKEHSTLKTHRVGS